MSVENTIRRVTRQEAWGSILLWFGVLAPPLAWATQLIVNYSLEEWFACSPGTQEKGRILGIVVDTWALVVTSALLAVSLLGLIVAIGCFRKLRGTGDNDSYQRARWMALAGIFNGVLYTIIIVVGYATPAILGSCRTSP